MTSIQHTGLGYEYIRDRAGGDDVTVYVHQLVALLRDDVDPSQVFAPDHEVHHVDHIPWHNTPQNLELRESREHRVGHLSGEVSA
ncbi:hypothetical protein [Haloarcula salina]|uniref:HNH endonuclease n=1 Tax=Haloarcula salina TaxID=1429914 RepID=A0AA41G418_9EURY|nr:hypothetical protein [Haloarcula salina]MBV0903932.1 hypothetical protein [Haloarcula salina]